MYDCPKALFRQAYYCLASCQNEKIKLIKKNNSKKNVTMEQQRKNKKQTKKT